MNLTPAQLKAYESIYLLYLDETGHTVFNPRKVYTDVNGRFLTIGGVLIRGDLYWTQLHPAIDRLKREFFGNTDVILHYTELFLPRGTSGLREEQREPFWREFVKIITSIDLALVSITVDKQRFQSKPYPWLYEPYHLIVAWHIERLVFGLSRIERQQRIVESGKPPLRARIVIEARSGSREPRTEQEQGPGRGLAASYRREARSGSRDTGTGQERRPDRRLAASYRRVFNNGSKIFQTVKAKDVQKRLTSNEISIANKKDNKNGLQVADLVCLPMHWNTLFELCPDVLREMKGAIQKSANVDYFWRTARHKVAADENGEIKGFGIKLFPDTNKPK